MSCLKDAFGAEPTIGWRRRIKVCHRPDFGEPTLTHAEPKLMALEKRVISFIRAALRTYNSTPNRIRAARPAERS
jgi:hypothetical protein